MTSIGDKLVLQLPLTAVTQALEQIAGDAAINVAKSISGSDTADESQMLLPSAGIAADPSGSSTGQVSPSDFALQSSPLSDALMGLRPPDVEAQPVSYGDILQAAQLLSSPDIAPDQSDAGNGVRADAGDGASAPSDAVTVPAAQTSTIAPSSMPTPASSAAPIDQRPGAIAETAGNGAAETDAAPPLPAKSQPEVEGTAAMLGELPETELVSEQASAGQTSDAAPAAATQTTTATQLANSQVTTSIDARFDGSLMATEVISRPDTPQMVAAVITSNLTTTAVADKLAADTRMPSEAPDQVRSSDGGDIVTWQVGRQDGGASFAAIDIGAKQSATWSDAQDQSRANIPVGEPTRATAETNGFDAPRPTQSITTGALVGAVLSSDQSTDVQSQPGMLPPEQLADASSLDLKTGITPSGILNAAMIPGWPQQQLAGRMHPEEALSRGGAMRGMSDEEMLTYLANLGADEEMLDKVKKALKKPVAGRKITFYLASLATAMSVVFKSLAGEIETMMQEDAETAEVRKHADARGRKTRRHRLYLE